VVLCTDEDDDDETLVGPAIPGDLGADELVGPEPPKPKRRKVCAAQGAVQLRHCRAQGLQPVLARRRSVRMSCAPSLLQSCAPVSAQPTASASATVLTLCAGAAT